jgi:ParB/RepB/Spo0J family partition protein
MDIESISLDKLEPFPINPNKESEEVYRKLVDEIKTDGFDQPLLVIESPDNSDKYVVVSGNHRLKAISELGHSEAHCIVKNWDMDTARLKVVQRNVLHGEVDTAKFHELVHAIVGDTAMTLPDMAEEMGFTDYDDFARMMVFDEEAVAEIRDSSSQETSGYSAQGFVNSLQKVMEAILEEFGETTGQSYIWFMYKSMAQVMVDMDPESRDAMRRVTEHCGVYSKNINEVLPLVINAGMDSLDNQSEDVFDFDDEELDE